MKKILTLLILILTSSAVLADFPKVVHVMKVKLKTSDQTFVSYAVVLGELRIGDAILDRYKNDAKEFTDDVKHLMGQRAYDSLDLYSQIFKVREENLVLLPRDKKSQIALKDIQQITLIKYVQSEYAGNDIFTTVYSSDSTWLSWKVSRTERFGPISICDFRMLLFNMPDENTKAVIKEFESTLQAREKSVDDVPDREIDKFRERFRKLRVIVIRVCSC